MCFLFTAFVNIFSELKIENKVNETDSVFNGFFKRNIQRFIYLRTPGNDNKRIKKNSAYLEYNICTIFVIKIN